MIIELSKYKVQIKDALTWWDAQEITAIQMSSAKLVNNALTGVDGTSFMQSTLKLIEKMIMSVKEGDKEIGFSEKWLKELSMEDGEKLHSEIEKITTKDSKKN